MNRRDFEQRLVAAGFPPGRAAEIERHFLEWLTRQPWAEVNSKELLLRWAESLGMSRQAVSQLLV